MNSLTFDELVDEYKNCVKIHYDTDYANKSSLRKANQAVDRMIKISKYISEKYPSLVDRFAELLECDEFRTDDWVAHHILENMKYPPDNGIGCYYQIFSRKYSRRSRK